LLAKSNKTGDKNFSYLKVFIKSELTLERSGTSISPAFSESLID
jgi:hypothetical protein